MATAVFDPELIKRFVQAKHDDYGTRRATVKALVYHMAEGWNVWRYLSTGNVARGVSVHFTVEQDGEVVQMMGLNRISGSINPNTLRTDNDTYYGARHAKGVLGSWWSNPNHAVLSVEIAGKAVDGPNAKQVASCVALFASLRRLYPKIVPLGHRDFQNVKRCPGTTAAIKAVFDGDGGHGLDYKAPDSVSGGGALGEDDGKEMIQSPNIKTGSDHVVSIPAKTKVYYEPGDPKEAFIVTGTADRPLYGYGRHDDADWMAVGFVTSKTFSDGKPRPVIGWVKGRKTPRKIESPPTDQAKWAAAQQAVLSAGVAVDNASELINVAEKALEGTV